MVIAARLESHRQRSEGGIELFISHQRYAAASHPLLLLLFTALIPATTFTVSSPTHQETIHLSLLQLSGNHSPRTLILTQASSASSSNKFTFRLPLRDLHRTEYQLLAIINAASSCLAISPQWILLPPILRPHNRPRPSHPPLPCHFQVELETSPRPLMEPTLSTVLLGRRTE